jgi:hypothetical protein
LQALYEHWRAYGANFLRKVREDRPHEYLKPVASLLPKQLVAGMHDTDIVRTGDFHGDDADGVPGGE